MAFIAQTEEEDDQLVVGPKGEEFSRVDEVVDTYTRGLERLAEPPKPPSSPGVLTGRARSVRDGAISDIDQSAGRQRPGISDAARRVRDEALSSVDSSFAQQLPPDRFAAPSASPSPSDWSSSRAPKDAMMPPAEAPAADPTAAAPAQPPRAPFLTETELAAEAARGATPTRVTDIAAAQAESGGEVDGSRSYMSPSERDAALEVYNREENARQDEARMAQAAAQDPTRRGSASPVPALRGDGGEYRGEEMGLPPEPAFVPPEPIEVVSEEVEEQITEETPENERQMREVAEVIATAKPGQDGEPEFNVDSARRRAYVTSGIIDIVNGLIVGIAGGVGGAIDPRVVAQALSQSEAPLTAFREMAQAARERRQEQERERRLMSQDAQRKATNSRQMAADARADRQMEMREQEFSEAQGERARAAELRDAESEGSAAARGRYVDQLVDLGVDRSVAEARVQGESGADIAARADELDALRAARAEHFKPRRGRRGATGRSWGRQLQAMGYGAAQTQGGGRGSRGSRRGPGNRQAPPASPGSGQEIPPEMTGEAPPAEVDEAQESAAQAVAAETARIEAIESRIDELSPGSTARNRAEQQLERANARLQTRRRAAARARVNRGIPPDETPAAARVNHYTRVPGSPELSRQEVSALRNYQTAAVKVESMSRRLARMMETMSGRERVGGAFGINSDQMREARALHGRLSTEIRRMADMGVPQEFEMRLVNEQIPPPDSFGAAINGAEAYRALRRLSVTERNQNMGSVGYTPAERLIVRDANGRRVRMYPSQLRAARTRNLTAGRHTDDPNLGLEVIGGDQ